MASTAPCVGRSVGETGRSSSRSERPLAPRPRVDASALPLVVGDADDPQSMTDLVRSAKVVCTTVGPYALYGSALVAACAREGTDYCDLTGEIHWIRQMIDAHQAEAEASGARLVPTSGFDCIPSDLGVFFLQSEMQKRHGVSSPQVKLRVEGFSGGGQRWNHRQHDGDDGRGRAQPRHTKTHERPPTR